MKDIQSVHAGDPLVQIDPSEFEARVASAEAAVADAQAKVAGARAALSSLTADQEVARADADVARTAIPSARAEQSRAGADDARYSELLRDGFVTRRDAERTAAAAVAAKSQLNQSMTNYQAARKRATATGSRRDALRANLAKAEAMLAKARASLDLARQDVGYTIVRAAIDGRVGNRQAHVGDLVRPGSRLLTIVPAEDFYIVANFKETQTKRMVVGQPATVAIDALDSEEIKGRVESFAPASGLEFALIPFEPGSGNFTKIVQRVPVRISVSLPASKLAHLRPGLSATATVRVRS